VRADESYTFADIDQAQRDLRGSTMAGTDFA
jgi:hypothetical protein